MEDGGGIIHHAERIDYRLEFLFLKAAPDAVGKARTHEKHLFARADPKPRILYINNCPELHYSLLTIHYSLKSAPADLQSCGRQRHLHKTGILILTMLAQDLFDTDSSLGILGNHIEIAATTGSRQFIT